ncbi:hypothetical protein KKP62_00140 [Rhodococcus sp. GOMB7]|uniref:hypothetical protein n=1 Tax=unclassified Rhodococcus (in: high G+C Gram-positive bacteria) TaxID=192944 RepID=UPI0004A8B72A|nr:MULTISPECIES: hypothetical protein [unclassified Rhodococcus (in: high G+C Gram-positive bacteria)]KDQ04737.1 hypothetical protein EN35_27765 [Rhodococcus qingshengii]MBT9293381.1 hypothetical protein [Rhodococcus sp. GOMB7]MDV8014872.1 hypothetical protein [Rhodococcus sp. IEGM 1241]
MGDYGDTADPRWSIYMVAKIPEYTEVRDEVLRHCRSRQASIDGDRLLHAVVSASWQCLRELSIGRRDITWEALCLLRANPDFDHQKLAAYLSTKGAAGIAVNDKLCTYLTHVVPRRLAALVDCGNFDLD